MKFLAEIAIALLSPIASFIGKMIVKKIKKKIDQKLIKINVKSPDYNGTANHWVTYLDERIKTKQEKQFQYAYLGDDIQTSIEKDNKVSTIKIQVPNVDKDALKELMLKKQWNNQNDPIHGNGVFNLALPQITHANLEGEPYQIQYLDLSSIPLNGKYLFTTKLESLSFEKYDPDEFYKHGGSFEIPVYLEKSTPEYQVYPITPPAPKIPDYAIKTKIIKEKIVPSIEEPQVFVFCPFCGTKMPKSKNLKFCLLCGKNIEQHLNF